MLKNTENAKEPGIEKHFVWGYGKEYAVRQKKKKKSNDGYSEFC